MEAEVETEVEAPGCGRASRTWLQGDEAWCGVEGKKNDGGHIARRRGFIGGGGT
jgi:hypothetical protein